MRIKVIAKPYFYEGERWNIFSLGLKIRYRLPNKTFPCTTDVPLVSYSIEKALRHEDKNKYIDECLNILSDSKLIIQEVKEAVYKDIEKRKDQEERYSKLTQIRSLVRGFKRQKIVIYVDVEGIKSNES
jgi:hypothetical protein